MISKTLSAILLASTTVFFAAGCGGADLSAEELGEEDEVSEAEAISAKITPGEFKLYNAPRTKPNQFCDRYTKLSLKAAYYSTATLVDAVDGMCEIAVIPNPRTYRLRQTGTSCGSKTYAGSVVKNGKRSEISITDHRTRVCRDIVPAKIIVTEKKGGASYTSYSYDGPVGGEPITVTGKLVSTVGIGGENTGRSISNDAGVTELVLDASESGLFEDGKTARVKGTTTILSGVETGNRTAIDVESLLVCPNPGWINCMPGIAPPGRPSRSPSLCGGEDHEWVKANCPGVDFAF